MSQPAEVWVVCRVTWDVTEWKSTSFAWVEDPDSAIPLFNQTVTMIKGEMADDHHLKARVRLVHMVLPEASIEPEPVHYMVIRRRTVPMQCTHSHPITCWLDSHIEGLKDDYPAMRVALLS